MEKLKHLEMTQTVINRLAGNSFLVKGWSVTIVSAILALGSKDANKRFLFVAYYPVLMFWILDAYYLWQERLFRKLYDRIRENSGESIDFSMNTTSLKKETGWTSAFLSLTLILFYGIMIFAVLVAYYILFGLY